MTKKEVKRVLKKLIRSLEKGGGYRRTKISDEIEIIIVKREIEKENYSVRDVLITGIMEKENSILCQVEIYYYGTVGFMKTTAKIDVKELIK